MGCTLDDTRRAARARLADTSVSPRLDAQRLLEYVLGVGTAYLVAHGDRAMEPAQAMCFNALVERRAAGEPIAYLTGEIGFWTLDLRVDARVLVPRPDTETLVAAVLARLGESPARVADLGTGSGAVALALASERPAWRIWATDADSKALACARANAARLAVANVCFAQGEWLAPLAGRRFEAIAANPPYVDAADAHLRAPSLRFEPRAALIAADHGLADLARITADAPGYLAPGGWLLLEHGFDQGAAVRELLRPCFERIETLADLGGRPRVTTGRRISAVSDVSARAGPLRL